MKTKLLYIICILLLQLPQGFAQDSAGKVVLTVSPALLSPFSLAVQGGVLVHVGQKWGVLAEAAFPLFKQKHSTYTDIQSWRTGIEIKRYRTKTAHPGMYYSFQAAYLFRELTDGSGRVQRRDRSYYNYDAASVHSPVLSAALKLGREITSRNERKMVDVFIGVGLRRVLNRYEMQNARVATLDERPADNFAWIFPAEGWSYDYPLTRFHFTAGFRVGFKVKS